MSKKEKKILDKNATKIIELLKSAYCDEMHIFHYFCNVGINMEGIGLVMCIALKTQATRELAHAKLLADRISQLGNSAPRNPVRCEKYDLATTRLADEVKDEQHTEDTVKSREVK